MRSGGTFKPRGLPSSRGLIAPGIVDLGDKNLAVRHLGRVCPFQNRRDGRGAMRLSGSDHSDFDFGKETDHEFGSTIDFRCVRFLSAKASGLH